MYRWRSTRSICTYSMSINIYTYMQIYHEIVWWYLFTPQINFSARNYYHLYALDVVWRLYYLVSIGISGLDLAKQLTWVLSFPHNTSHIYRKKRTIFQGTSLKKTCAYFSNWRTTKFNKFSINSLIHRDEI